MGQDNAAGGDAGGTSAANWSVQLNTGSHAAATAPVDSATSAALGSQTVVWLGSITRGTREHVSLLGTLGCASLLLLACEFVKPTATDAPTIRATIETVLAVFALAAVWLIRGQFQRTRRRREMLLLAAVLAQGVIHIWTYGIPAVLDLSVHGFLGPMSLWGELFVAATFAAAALTPADCLVLDRRPDLLVAGISLGGLAASALGARLLGGDPAGKGIGIAGLDGMLAHPVALALAIAAAALMACAAVGFERADRGCRVRPRGGSLLAGAALLLSAAWLSHLTGMFAPGRVAPTDSLRLAAFGLILAMAMRWELQARTLTTRVAALAERRRVARDLHDSLAQDLALIAAHGDRMADDIGPEHPVIAAARRALAISRTAIADLSDPAGATPQEALEVVAGELRSRFQIAIALDVQLKHDLRADVQEDISRIAREAITNAARHGGAENVLVSLRDPEGVVRLRVRDDGRGFERAASECTSEGFGLRSMRERATAMGGYMTVRQPPPHGTLLEVVLP